MSKSCGQNVEFYEIEKKINLDNFFFSNPEKLTEFANFKVAQNHEIRSIALQNSHFLIFKILK